MKIRSLLGISLVCLCFSPLLRAEDKQMSWPAPPAMQIDVNKTYTATLETNQGTIVLDLFAKEAPKTVNSFVYLAKQGFYDGTEFHRVIPGFMIQGGDRNGNPKGTGGPGYEFENENKDTGRTFKVGTVGMANSGPDTNGSQFFVMDSDNPLPPSSYTIFGQLQSGQDVVHKIATVARNDQDHPNEPVILKKVTISEK